MHVKRVNGNKSSPSKIIKNQKYRTKKIDMGKRIQGKKPSLLRLVSSPIFRATQAVKQPAQSDGYAVGN